MLPVESLDFRLRRPAVHAGIESLIRIDQIDQTMGYGFTLLAGRLVGRDIHPTVHLTRIGREQIGPERAGNHYADLALSHGSRPHQHDQRSESDILIG